MLRIFLARSFAALSVGSVCSAGALVLISGCTPSIDLSTGGGGSGSTTSQVVGPGVTSTTTGAATTTATSSSSTGAGGTGPVTEFLYKAAFPSNNPVWEKVAISAAFPGDPNAPTSSIVSAVRLQSFSWMMWITGDGMAHVAVNGAWQPAVPIDAALGTGLGCKKINQHLVNTTCVDDAVEPPCQPLSTLSGFTMNHVPGNACGNQPLKEGIGLTNASVATNFDITGPAGTVAFVGQRDYLTDCYPDAASVVNAPIWAFQIVRPASCPGDWYDSYVFRANQRLYMQNAADIGTGVETNSWPLDATNPLMAPAADPNRPDLSKVTAAYYENDTSKVVLIAP